MAKTDWQMGDTVLPDDLNQIGQEINQNRDNLAAHTAATTGVHGATSAATPNTIVQRDSAGRIKAAAPAAADDVARKAEVDAVQTNLTNHITDYVRQPGYAAATGSANTYAVTLSPAPTSYVDGMAIAVKINVDNTGASTINVNGLGAKAIKKPNGSDVSAGNLKAGSIYTLRYNGTNFILQGEGGSGNAQPTDVLSGKTFTNDAGEQTGTMSNHGAVNQTLTSQGQEYTIPAGYHNGSGKVAANITNLTAANIAAGKTVGGIAGTFSSDATATAAQILSGQTAYVNGSKVTGSMTNRGAVSQTLTSQGQEYTIPAGYHNGSGKVTANITNLSAGNIAAGKTVGGVAGTFSSDATATAAQILTGRTAYVNGAKVTGSMANRTGHVTGQSVSRSGTTIRIRPQVGYYPGDSGNSVQISDANFIAANIRNGVSIFGLAGTLNPSSFASGSVTSSTNSIDFVDQSGDTVTKRYVDVGGLAFKPKTILLYRYDRPTHQLVYYTEVNISGDRSQYSAQIFEYYSTSTNQGSFYQLTGNAYVSSSGFRLPVTSSSLNYEWYAWG